MLPLWNAVSFTPDVTGRTPCEKFSPQNILQGLHLRTLLCHVCTTSFSLSSTLSLTRQIRPALVSMLFWVLLLSPRRVVVVLFEEFWWAGRSWDGSPLFPVFSACEYRLSHWRKTWILTLNNAVFWITWIYCFHYGTILARSFLSFLSFLRIQFANVQSEISIWF